MGRNIVDQLDILMNYNENFNFNLIGVDIYVCV